MHCEEATPDSDLSKDAKRYETLPTQSIELAA
jgi:hypothetical protein